MVKRTTDQSRGEGVGVRGALTIKKGRDVLPRARDPYPFPDTIETPFQTKVRRTYIVRLSLLTMTNLTRTRNATVCVF